MLLAKLVERSFAIPEVRDSNPVIGTLIITYLLSTVLKRKKRPGMAQLLKPFVLARPVNIHPTTGLQFDWFGFNRLKT